MIGKGVIMKHDDILEQLLFKARGDSNTLGFLVFGSVSLGTHDERSDIDLIEISENMTHLQVSKVQ